MRDGTDVLREGVLESQRFGLRVFRGSVEHLDEQRLLEELLEKRVDVAMVRLLRNGHEQLHRLVALGFPTLVADTLVYYGCDLTRHVPGARRDPSLEFIECREPQAASVERLVGLSFANYRNHYSSNPLLSHSGLVEGYKEWTRPYTAGGDPSKRAWLVRSNGEDVAFATCAFEGATAEIVLNGVHPEREGRGIYGDLINFIQVTARDLGASMLKISTQVSNFAVQKVWGRSGFSLTDAYLTVHINALLDAPGAPRWTRAWRCPEPSGDREASAAGPGDPIVHGARAVSELSRFFATEFPGPGSSLTAQRLKFLRPLQAGRDYTFEYRFPVHDAPRGSYLAVATLRDAEGRACLLSQTELLAR